MGEHAGMHHYTTSSGLLGILESNELWLTDVRFMNDASELLYPSQIIMEAVRRIAAPSVRATRDVLNGLRERGTAVVEIFNVYSMSFCAKADLLSQWRGYGGDQGFAIEFNRDAFGADCWPMEYDRASSEKLVQERVMRFIDDTNGLGVNTLADDARFLPTFTDLAHDLLTLALKMKHGSFEEEEETRFVLLAKGDDLASVRFRSTSFGLVPYVAVSRVQGLWRASEPNDNREKLPIVSITCGPSHHSSLGETALKMLVSQAGYPDVAIGSSAIPLRH